MTTKLRITVEHTTDSSIIVLIINSNSTLHLHFFAGDLAALLVLKCQAKENYRFLVDEDSWYYLPNTSLKN